MSSTSPLEDGEYVDLDSGARVIRGEDGEAFILKETRKRTNYVVLSREEVATLARLSGFSVVADEGDSA